MPTIVRSRPRSRGVGALARLTPALTVASCLAAPESALDAPGTARQNVGGIEGTFEYALDAPWRVEPELRQGIGRIGSPTARNGERRAGGSPRRVRSLGDLSTPAARRAGILS